MIRMRFAIVAAAAGAGDGAAGPRAVAGGQRHHRRHGQGHAAGRRCPGSRSRSPTPTPAPSASSSPTTRAPIARRCCRSAATTSSAELQGFKKFEQTGITLSAGQTARRSTSTLQRRQRLAKPSRSPASRRSRSPARSTSAAPSARPKSRTCRSSRATPTTSRSCRPTSPATRTTSSACRASTPTASQMHTNYQLDGNTNTEKDRAGLRMLPVSEVLVREVKVITNGFAPEFGQTTGMVYNAITPSGTNDLHGSASFRFKRNAMSARPFFLAADRAQARHRGQRRHRARSAARSRATRLHFFGAYEFVDRSLVTGGQVITVTPANAARARHHAAGERRHPGAPEGQLRASARSTTRSTRRTTLSARYFLFKNFSRVEHRRRPDHAPIARPTSPIGWTRRRRSWSRRSAAAMLNELRVQYARRHQFRTPAASAVDGPAITVIGHRAVRRRRASATATRSASTSTRASGR